MIYEETSGDNPDSIYQNKRSMIFSAWGYAWGNSWGKSWGFFSGPRFPQTSNAPGNPFEENSVSGTTIYNETSGVGPDIIYEEN